MGGWGVGRPEELVEGWCGEQVQQKNSKNLWTAAQIHREREHACLRRPHDSTREMNLGFTHNKGREAKKRILRLTDGSGLKRIRAEQLIEDVLTRCHAENNKKADGQRELSLPSVSWVSFSFSDLLSLSLALLNYSSIRSPSSAR